MEAKCLRRNCAWVLDVPHMDSAVESVREHYRAVHPTKWLNVQSLQEGLEAWNRTVEDWLELCVLPNGQDGINYQYVNEYLQGYMGEVASLMPDAVRAELQRLYDEWLAQRRGALADPFAVRPVNPAAFFQADAAVDEVAEENAQDAAGPEVWAAPIPAPAPLPRFHARRVRPRPHGGR